MQDRPDAPDLLDAVASFVADELQPALTDPRLRYRTLVAANVLRVVARELRAGDVPLRDEWRRLAALLDQHAVGPPADDASLRVALQEANRALCGRIRAGEVDQGPRSGAVWAHVEETVIEKLRVANPRFLERLDAE